jgi:hypothetical protein
MALSGGARRSPGPRNSRAERSARVVAFSTTPSSTSRLSASSVVSRWTSNRSSSTAVMVGDVSARRARGTSCEGMVVASSGQTATRSTAVGGVQRARWPASGAVARTPPVHLPLRWPARTRGCVSRLMDKHPPAVGPHAQGRRLSGHGRAFGHGPHRATRRPRTAPLGGHAYQLARARQGSAGPTRRTADPAGRLVA